MHKVEEKALVTPALLRRFQMEGRGLPFWGLIQTSEGKFLEHATGPDPIGLQRQVACDIVGALNKHLDHDGCWLWLYADPGQALPVSIEPGTEYGRFVIMWMDQDGDIQFPIEFDRPFIEYCAEGPDPMMEKCEGAWNTWRWAMKEVPDAKDSQTFKRALSEGASASTMRAALNTTMH